MVLEIFDTVRLDETGETGIVIGDRDSRKVVSISASKIKFVSPLRLTRLLS
jgi:hypothetical protein